MQGFTWDGEFFPFIQPDDWTIGETRALERYLERTLSEATDIERAACSAFVSIKRIRPGFRWADVDALPVRVLVDLAESMEPESEVPQVEDVGAEILSPTNGAREA